MDGRIEKRVAIKFCCKACLSATQILVLVQKADGSENLNRSNGLSWYSQFWYGRELVEYDENGGCPKSSQTEVNVAAVSDLVKNYLQITSRIAEYLNIPKTLVLRILKQDLGKRKLCARFVPHCLTPEQREDRVTSCQDIIKMADAGKFFFNKIATGDEAWCFAFDPKTKWQNSEWAGETSPRPKKLIFERSHIKAMLIILLTLQVIVHKEFIPEGKTIIAELYKGIMDHLLKRIQRVRPATLCSQDFLLLC